MPMSDASWRRFSELWREHTGLKLSSGSKTAVRAAGDSVYDATVAWQGTYNSSIPEPFRTNLSLEDKANLLRAIATVIVEERVGT